MGLRPDKGPIADAAARSPMRPSAGSADDKIIAESIDMLRRKKNGAAVPTPGGLLRRSSSGSANIGSSGSSGSANIDKLAVESVHSGIVVALDKDCRAYRAEIKQLREAVVALQDRARPEVWEELVQEKVKLQAEVKLLRQQASYASRAHEVDQQTIADLRGASEKDGVVVAKQRLGSLVAERGKAMHDLEERLGKSSGALRLATERIEELNVRVAELSAHQAEAERSADVERVRATEAEARATEAQARAQAVMDQARTVTEKAAADAAETKESSSAAEAAAAGAAAASARVAALELDLAAAASRGGEQQRALSQAEERADAATRRLAELEIACREHDAEIAALRNQLEEQRTVAPAAATDERSPPPAAAEVAAPIVSSADPTASRALGGSALSRLQPEQDLARAQAQVESLSAENAGLREKVEHMSVLLMGSPSKTLSSAATSPLKLPRK